MSIASKLRKTGNTATAVDGEVAEAVAPLHQGGAARALALVSQLGDQPQLRPMSSALVAIGLVSANRRLAGAGARMLLAHEAATLAKDFVKNRIDRTRPRSARRGKQRKLRPGQSKAKEEAAFLRGTAPGLSRSPALTPASALSAVQISRSAHYLSDVAAGALVGWAAEAVANLAWPFSAGSSGEGEKARANGDG